MKFLWSHNLKKSLRFIFFVIFVDKKIVSHQFDVVNWYPDVYVVHPFKINFYLFIYEFKFYLFIYLYH